MPIYEYQCKKCEHKLEALQKMSDSPLLKCPECGKKSLSKLVSAASFRLKGGGWYETDFKTGNKKQLADTDSSSANDGGAAKPSKESADSTKSADISKPASADKKPAASKEAANTTSKVTKKAS